MSMIIYFHSFVAKQGNQVLIEIISSFINKATMVLKLLLKLYYIKVMLKSTKELLFKLNIL